MQILNSKNTGLLLLANIMNIHEFMLPMLELCGSLLTASRLLSGMGPNCFRNSLTGSLLICKSSTGAPPSDPIIELELTDRTEILKDARYMVQVFKSMPYQDYLKINGYKLHSLDGVVIPPPVTAAIEAYSESVSHDGGHHITTLTEASSACRIATDHILDGTATFGLDLLSGKTLIATPDENGNYTALLLASFPASAEASTSGIFRQIEAPPPVFNS